MLKKEHLTELGLRKIVAIKASMNRGLSSELKSAFSLSPILPRVRPLILNQTIKAEENQWLAGFTSADGSFMVVIRAWSNLSVGFQVKLVFQVTQHSRDEKLMRSLIEYFDCGNILQRGEAFDFRVTRFEDIRPLFFFTKKKGGDNSIF